MTPYQLFEYTTHGPWLKAGLDVSFKSDVYEGKRYVAFKCTDSNSDWTHNFDASVISYRRSVEEWKVHKGFVALYKSVRETIQKYFDAPDIVFTGYSQGAALATLAHEDYVYTHAGMLIPSSSVFASPRVIASKNIDWRFSTLKRYEVQGDIVTKVPFEWMGYHHVGKKISLGPKKIIPLPKYHEPDMYRRYL